MRKFFISTLTAIALAVPLGVGGLIFATSPAEAFVQRLKHHFNTCSRHVIWECDTRVQARILFQDDFGYIFRDPQWYPYGANGADQATFGTLEWRLRNRFGDEWDLAVYPLYLREVFSDDDIPDSFDHPWRGMGFISPEWRTRYERHLEEEERRARIEEHLAEEMRLANEEELRLANDPDYAIQQAAERLLDRSIDDCRNVGGTVGLGPANNILCEGGTGAIDIFGGFDPVNPGAEVTALLVEPIARLNGLSDIEDIEDHREITSENRETIVDIVDQFNTLEERVLAHNDRIAENSFLVEAVADRLVDVDDRAKKNTAGIALGYALATPGLLADKRFAFGGGVGNFEGENAVAFTLTGRITDSIVANVGGGMAGSGDTGVNGFKGTISFQW